MSVYIPKIGITVGDINGVGLEIILRIFHQSAAMTSICTPVIFAPLSVLQTYASKINFPIFDCVQIKKERQIATKKINVVELWDETCTVTPGTYNRALDKYTTLSITEACKAAKEKIIDGIVTSPVHKSSLIINGKSYTGHTDLFRSLFHTPEILMLMVAEQFKIALQTEHIPLKQVASRITQKAILTTLHTLHHSLERDFNITKPKIAVLGLNPHKGEDGMMGDEEKQAITPAIQTARTEHNILTFGPYSADGFFGFQHVQHFDCILAMYHDQGLIPFKVNCGETGVNYTTSLPFIRTSPDHGTAMDIAGKNIASTSSFRNAIYTCIDAIRQRRLHAQLQTSQ